MGFLLRLLQGEGSNETLEQAQSACSFSFDKNKIK
jgi:hypothetical protein